MTHNEFSLKNNIIESFFYFSHNRTSLLLILFFTVIRCKTKKLTYITISLFTFLLIFSIFFIFNDNIARDPRSR